MLSKVKERKFHVLMLCRFCLLSLQYTTSLRVIHSEWTGLDYAATIAISFKSNLSYNYRVGNERVQLRNMHCTEKERCIYCEDMINYDSRNSLNWIQIHWQQLSKVWDENKRWSKAISNSEERKATDWQNIEVVFALLSTHARMKIMITWLLRHLFPFIYGRFL